MIIHERPMNAPALHVWTSRLNECELMMVAAGFEPSRAEGRAYSKK